MALELVKKDMIGAKRIYDDSESMNDLDKIVEKYIHKDAWCYSENLVEVDETVEEVADENYKEVHCVYADEDLEEEYGSDPLATIFITHNDETYIHFWVEFEEMNWINDIKIPGTK